MIILLLLFGFQPVFAQQGVTEDYGPVVAAIVEAGEVSLNSYTPENGILTGNDFSRMYFDIFETSGMEFTLGLKANSHMLKIESGFSLLSSQAMRGEPKENLLVTWQQMRADLDYAVEHYSSGGIEASFWGRTLQSFLILFREGVEAMLVVAALVAYLRRSGNGDKVKIIWHGVVWALGASVGAAYIFNALITSSGASKEAMEGLTMILAALVLVYVSYWLTAKSDADRWQAFVKGKMNSAVESGNMYALGFVAFLAVFREGAETILFYQALIAGAGGTLDAVWAGMGLAFISLVIVYGIIRFASIQLPLKLFFSTTAILLFTMAFVFTGKGIMELQVAQWIATTKVHGWPMITWLGMFPTRETIIGQIFVLLCFPLGMYMLKRGKEKHKVKEVASV